MHVHAYGILHCGTVGAFNSLLIIRNYACKFNYLKLCLMMMVKMNRRMVRITRYKRVEEMEWFLIFLWRMICRMFQIQFSNLRISFWIKASPIKTLCFLAVHTYIPILFHTQTHTIYCTCRCGGLVVGRHLKGYEEALINLHSIQHDNDINKNCRGTQQKKKKEEEIF